MTVINTITFLINWQHYVKHKKIALLLGLL